MENNYEEISKCLLNFITELAKSGKLTFSELSDIMTKTGYSVVCDYKGDINTIGTGEKILKFKALG